MVNRNAVLAALLLVGVVLLLVSIDTSFFVAEPWFNERAHDEWHMNNYIVVPGFIAFVFFSFLSWFLGAFFVAFTLPSFGKFAYSKRKWLIATFILGIFFSCLGFNTFDFMLGCFYWTNGCEPPPVMIDLMVTSFGVNAWNFYFFFYLVPLYASGICFGLALVLAWLKPKL